jgi:hypothetical protein
MSLSRAAQYNRAYQIFGYLVLDSIARVLQAGRCRNAAWVAYERERHAHIMAFVHLMLITYP